jgi:hypothetical protein
MAVTKLADRQLIESIDLTSEVVNTLPVGNGGTGLTAPGTNGNVLTSTGSAWASSAPTGGSSTPTASTNAQWDTNANMSANAFLALTTSTATAGSTTVLSITSTQVQIFTGSANQTVKLPTTGVLAGMEYIIVNNSTGTLTVQSSGANQIATMPPSTIGEFQPVVNGPTTAAHWQAEVYSDGATLTFPSATDTIAGIAATQTLTNKRVNPRATTTNAPGATPTVATDSNDLISFTGLAAAITSMTTNLTGTPVLGQKLMLGFKDNGTARAITWGASYKSSGAATLLATTVAGKQHWQQLMYDGTSWVCLAVDASGY